MHVAHFDLDANKKTILIIGGSLGARTINNSIKNKLQELEDSGHQLLWQTGKIYIDEVEKATVSSSENIKPMAFISRMDLAYAAADIVISRAGALSVSELCLVKKPVILVPSPNVAEDHQTKNAMSLVNKKAAVLVKDVDSPNILVETVLSLLGNPAEMTELSNQISGLGKPNAAIDIKNEVMKLVGKEYQ